MNLEQKVVNYELSKELVDNGIVLDTEFWWWRHDETGEYTVDISVNPSQVQGWTRMSPAPLLIEMLDIFSDFELEKDGKRYYLHVSETLPKPTSPNVLNLFAMKILALKQKGLLNI